MENFDEAMNRLLNETTEYINDVEYPAHKRELVAAARARDAPAPVLAVLQELPEKTYASHNDLVALFVKTDGRRGRRSGEGSGFGLFYGFRQILGGGD